MTPNNFQDNFQVDLGGLVELLSSNLYSGPRVFVRELLQNGVDAITARREDDLGAPGVIDVSIGQVEGVPVLRVTDSGRGLTLDQARNLLATIGASSKRDELGLRRGDYLGQFGIGLLSALMVADSIVVYSRSVDALDAPIRWEGTSAGTWQVEAVDTAALPPQLRGPGTTVELRQRDFDFARVPDLVAYYGQFLPVALTFDGVAQPAAVAPWEMGEEDQAQWCAANFGFTPFACVPLHDVVAGAQGVAFILADGAHPGQHLKHTVYLRRMLLGDRVGEILPEWAYFARVVVDVENLRPTASREQLADDDLLEETRDSFGKQLRDWLTELSVCDPVRFAEFVSLHLAGLKSLALVDEPTRRLVARSVPVPTTLGALSLDEVLERFGAINYSRTTKDFEAIAAVAAAREVCVVNAGYAFDEEIISRLRLDYPQATIVEMDPGKLVAQLAKPRPAVVEQLAALVTAMEYAVQGQNVTVLLRDFEPVDVPAIFLPHPDAAGQTIQRRAQAAEDAEPWLSLLDPQASRAVGAADSESQQQLVLNAASATLHQLAGVPDTPQLASVVTAACRGIYIQALIAAHRPLDTQARGWSANLFTALIHQLSAQF